MVVAEAVEDLDGDGRLEAVVVEGELGVDGPEPQRLRVGAWTQGELPAGDPPAGRKAEARPWKRLLESPVFVGDRVASVAFRALGCGPKGRAAVVALVDERPDEARHTILVWGGLPAAPVQLLRFATTTGHRDPSLVDVSFADQPLGFTVHDLEGDGVQELFLHHDPTLLSLRGPKGEERELLVGYRQRVFRCRNGIFVTAKERYVDLLRPLSVAPGRAGDGDPSSGIELRAGERLVLPAPPRPARGLRLVAGCGVPPTPGRAHGGLLAVRVDGLLDRPLELELDAALPAQDAGVVGAALLPVTGAPWARQLVLITREQPRAGAVTLELLRTEGATGCVGEVELL